MYYIKIVIEKTKKVNKKCRIEYFEEKNFLISKSFYAIKLDFLWISSYMCFFFFCLRFFKE